MKKVVLVCTVAVLSAFFFSCKNEVKEDATLTEIEVTEDLESDTNEDLALATLTEDASAEDQYMYVTAPSGLTLRAYANLQSDKLARMPYGTKVRVIKAEGNETMNVAGIKGGMDEVAYNHKKGYAFNGYLSKYFPPELNITPKGYASELKEQFPEVIYTEQIGGTASNPVNTQTLTLPGAQWHEAYIIAQRLFDFPKEFDVPNPKGKEKEVVVDSKPKKGIWTSQLEIDRTDNTLSKISYVYGSKKFDAAVTISKEGDGMKISKTETVK